MYSISSYFNHKPYVNKDIHKYHKKDKIPAYKISYPSSTKVKPELIKSVVYTEKQIKDMAMYASLHSGSLTSSGMLIYMLLHNLNQE